VHIKVRGLKGDVGQLAILDLLPGGFEVVVQPMGPEEHGDSEDQGDRTVREDEGDENGEDDVRGAGDQDESRDVNEGETAGATFALPISLPATTFVADYGDVREDRVVLYGNASTDAKEFVYSMKATNVGKYTVPPVQAEAMYDRSVIARSLAGKIEVVPR
jgi:uncharacterized protein YfaS (alpha-2-macroglobulin family)